MPSGGAQGGVSDVGEHEPSGREEAAAKVALVALPVVVFTLQVSRASVQAWLYFWLVAISIVPCLALVGLARVVRRTDALWGRKRAELTRRWLTSLFDKSGVVGMGEGCSPPTPRPPCMHSSTVLASRPYAPPYGHGPLHGSLVGPLPCLREGGGGSPTGAHHRGAHHRRCSSDGPMGLAWALRRRVASGMGCAQAPAGTADPVADHGPPPPRSPPSPGASSLPRVRPDGTAAGAEASWAGRAARAAQTRA